jgi:hypothetical protein
VKVIWLLVKVSSSSLFLFCSVNCPDMEVESEMQRAENISRGDTGAHKGSGSIGKEGLREWAEDDTTDLLPF